MCPGKPVKAVWLSQADAEEGLDFDVCVFFVKWLFFLSINTLF